MLSLFKYWMPAILWAGLICIFSTDSFSSQQTSRFLFPLFQWVIPHASADFLLSLQFLTRKLAHWTEYFVLAMLLYRAFRQKQAAPWQARWAIWTLALIFFYSLADEVHQAFVPSRTASVKDSLLDLFGGSCAICLIYIRQRMRLKGFLLPVSAASESSRR
jgi:VanZ family protein